MPMFPSPAICAWQDSLLLVGRSTHSFSRLFLSSRRVLGLCGILHLLDIACLVLCGIQMSLECTRSFLFFLAACLAPELLSLPGCFQMPLLILDCSINPLVLIVF